MYCFALFIAVHAIAFARNMSGDDHLDVTGRINQFFPYLFAVISIWKWDHWRFLDNPINSIRLVSKPFWMLVRSLILIVEIRVGQQDNAVVFVLRKVGYTVCPGYDRVAWCEFHV